MEPIHDLTEEDRRAGFVLFVCPVHQGIIVTFPTVEANCVCGKPAEPRLGEA